MYTFLISNFQISKTFQEVQSPDNFLFSILEVYTLYIPRTPEQPFSEYINYYIPSLIMGKIVWNPYNPLLKSLPAEGGN